MQERRTLSFSYLKQEDIPSTATVWDPSLKVSSPAANVFYIPLYENNQKYFGSGYENGYFPFINPKEALSSTSDKRNYIFTPGFYTEASTVTYLYYNGMPVALIRPASDSTSIRTSLNGQLNKTYLVGTSLATGYSSVYYTLGFLQPFAEAKVNTSNSIDDVRYRGIVPNGYIKLTTKTLVKLGFGPYEPNKAAVSTTITNTKSYSNWMYPIYTDIDYSDCVFVLKADGTVADVSEADSTCTGIVFADSNYGVSFVIDKNQYSSKKWSTDTTKVNTGETPKPGFTSCYPNNTIDSSSHNNAYTKLDFEGYKNTQAIAAAYPSTACAAYFCTTKSVNIGGNTVSGYLPAAGEYLLAKKDAGNFNSAISAMSGTPFVISSGSDNYTWTSTQCNTSAFYVSATNDYAFSGTKTSAYKARPFYPIDVDTIKQLLVTT